MEAGEPAGDVLAELVVVGAEFFVESGFFVEQDEEMDGKDYGGGAEDEDGVWMAEDDPEADPADEEAQVHRIADVAVKTNNN